MVATLFPAKRRRSANGGGEEKTCRRPAQRQQDVAALVGKQTADATELTLVSIMLGK
jgi:hypothetical protein